MKRLLMPFLLIIGLSKANAQTCPNDFLGPDISETVCATDFVNLENFFPELNTYVSVLWSPANTDPVSAPPGNYILSVVNAEGCIDQVNIRILAEPRPAGFQDKTVQICEGQTKDLTNIFTNLGNYLVDWGTSNPQAAPPGTYVVTIQTQDGNQCTFEATITVETVPSVNGQLPNVVVYNTANSLSAQFSTNNFRCITTDRDGRVWAGTTGGGLYLYDGLKWIKTQSGDTKTFRELVTPDIFSDGPRIWAASTGNNNSDAIAGGMYYISGNTFTRKVFSSMKYKCIGVDPVSIRYVEDSSGGLSSRFATSLVKVGNKLFAGLSLSTDLELNCDPFPVEEVVVKNGGLFTYDYTGTAPRWSKVENLVLPPDDIKVTAVGTRGTQVWVGFQNWCASGGIQCGTAYIAKHDAVTGLPAGIVNALNSPLPLSNNPIIRAIFTDSRGRTFVGLSGGMGIGVLDEFNTWHLLTSDNTKLPPGASVNFHAIAEANEGRVLIGTNAGLLEYTGSGSFTVCTSYRFYTTASGLPSNNVTDITYDAVNEQIWLTTDAGVCSVGDRVRTIRGYVYNVFCGKPGSATPELQGRPIANARVRLYDGSDALVDDEFTDAEGRFEITQGLPNINYKLKVTYDAGDGIAYNLEYPNVKYDSLIGLVPIPDSLLRDIITYIPKLNEECPELNIPVYSGPLTPPLTICLDQFDMQNAAVVIGPYSSVVTAQHRKRINNLVAYYFLLQVMETATKNSVKFSTVTGEAFMDMIESVLKMADINVKWKMYGTGSDTNADLAEKASAEAISVGTEMLLTCIRPIKVTLLANGNETAYKYVKYAEEILKAFGDIAAKVKIESTFLRGAGTAAQGMAVDVFKKLVGIGMAKLFLIDNEHDFQVKMNNAADESAGLNSGLDYEALYNRMILNNDNTALLYLLEDIRIEHLSRVDALKALAKFVEFVQKLAKIAGAFAGAPQLKAFLKVVEESSKLAQPFLHLAVATESTIGVDKNRVLQHRSFDESQLLSSRQPAASDQSSPVRNTPLNLDPSLNQKRLAYNSALLQLRATVASRDTVNFYPKADSVLKYDSVFYQSMQENNLQLYPYLANAYNLVPQFDQHFSHYNNQLYVKRLQYQFALYQLMPLYALDSFSTQTAGSITGTIDTLIALNDSAYFGLSQTTEILNSSNVPAPGYVISNVSYNYVREPSKSGTINVRFRNIGKQAVQNLRLKFLADSLMQLNSADSIFVGTLQPGESRNLIWTITTPSIDTSVSFRVLTMSDDGLVDDAYGVVSAFTKNGRAFTVKSGNWSDPATWSTGEVPTNITEVQILHKVNVDINGICKSLYSEVPGNLIINTGRNLTIVK